MLGASAHTDTFARDHLPPADQWPDFRLERFASPERLNAAVELTDRMVLLMVNEAARCIEEELVAGPEDVDYAMIRGTGFAPFRGGPLRYADARGLGEVTDALNALAEQEAHFAPCELLRGMAAGNRKFYDES